MNHTGAEHGGSTKGKLVRLLHHHQQAADAIRTTLALLEGQARATKAVPNGANGLPRLLTLAQAADVVRRARAKKAAAPPTTKHARGRHTAQVLRQRQRSAEMLAAFDTATPRPIPDGLGKHVSPLVGRGYLKRKGAGFIRTAKPFSVALSKPTP